MIRTLVAVAALPTIAAAQSDYSGASDNGSFTVLHQRPDQYSIVLNVAGKDPQTVSREIWRAAYTVCNNAPTTGNLADHHVSAYTACVNQARSDAVARYNRLGAGW